MNEANNDIEEKPKLYDINDGLKESLVCVIDILGYKKFMTYDNKQEGNRKLSLLKETFEKALRYAKKKSQSGDFPKCYLKSYTDNILIACPLEVNIPFPRQYRTFDFIISSLQDQFLIYGLLVRGACDIGEIYVDGDFVFGASLIEAHKLESKIAKYPRIVLSNKLVDKFKQIYQSPNPPFYQTAWDEYDFATNSNKKFLLKSNGIYFLNHLQFYELPDIEADEDYLKDYCLFAEHKKFIIKKTQSILSNNKPDENVIIKYLWLASYHNYFLNDLINRSQDYSGGICLVDIESLFGNEWKEYSEKHPDFKFKDFMGIKRLSPNTSKYFFKTTYIKKDK